METRENTELTIPTSAIDIARYSEPRGASKQAILAALVGSWNIYTDPVLTQYKPAKYIIDGWLSKITGAQLRNRLVQGCIVSTKDDCTYAVIYHKCTPSQCFKASEVMLSYRNTVLGNFVLVRPHTQATKQQITLQLPKFKLTYIDGIPTIITVKEEHQ